MGGELTGDLGKQLGLDRIKFDGKGGGGIV